MGTKTLVGPKAKKSIYTSIRATPTGRVPTHWNPVRPIAPRGAVVSNIPSVYPKPVYPPLLKPKSPPVPTPSTSSNLNLLSGSDKKHLTLSRGDYTGQLALKSISLVLHPSTILIVPLPPRHGKSDE